MERRRHNDRWCSTSRASASPSLLIVSHPSSPAFNPSPYGPSCPPFLRFVARFASGIYVITRRVYSLEFVTFITQFLVFQINCLIRATTHTHVHVPSSRESFISLFPFFFARGNERIIFLLLFFSPFFYVPTVLLVKLPSSRRGRSPLLICWQKRCLRNLIKRERGSVDRECPRSEGNCL